MPNMGSTGTVNVSREMMNQAVQAIDTYQTTITALNNKVVQELQSLIPSNWSGSAADGFNAFYTTKIAPNTGENLTKMLTGLKDICNAIKAQVPEESGVDEQLGQVNKQPGGGN